MNESLRPKRDTSPVRWYLPALMRPVNLWRNAMRRTNNRKLKRTAKRMGIHVNKATPWLHITLASIMAKQIERNG